MASDKTRKIFKLKRGGINLTKAQIKEIKEGRKKLRKELKKRGIRSKEEFENLAASMGLYFDRGRSGFLFWFRMHWLGGLLGALAAFLAVLMIFAAVQRMRGHYTINLSDSMLKEGFTLSETEDFEVTASVLFAEPADNVPCISIAQIPADIDSIDGLHNDGYFAYTYYIRNEGESTVGYTWRLVLNSESKDLSEGIRVLVFEDGVMRLYAKVNSETGEAEALPAYDDNSRGYINLPIMTLAEDSDQFQVIATVDNISYYRVVPDPFESDTVITSGAQSGVEPMEVHKYTVVLYLEGDDEDVTDDMIGGHLGVEMDFALESEEYDSEDSSFLDNVIEIWNEFWENLQFWN